ncbi:hypothetical protein IEC338SC_3082 [Acinetobacter pittii]|uniref:Uncharacterized protein n=1 Tax=Acinetobacter pittii TaxID=48296 RepID=A0AB33B9K0_ACIPI|nr:hypothetical protein [Acinetobacter pittii]AMX20196.1 hypothetical protein IEC338SC_3082 [Acinetobacter pittii]
MKAQQFIKDHGLERAKELLKRLHELGCPDDMQITVINGMWHRTANGFTYPELKRLVESVDKVNQRGGYLATKELLSFSIVHQEAFGKDAVSDETINSLKGEIADYESIYGEGNEKI